MTKLPHRYWDSCCFLAILNVAKPDENHGQTCIQILNDARDGHLLIVTSFLTMAEVVRPKSSPASIPEDMKTKVQDFFENDYVQLRNVDRLIAETAQKLCWTYRTHPRDAIHLATALEMTCESFETTDTRLLRLDNQIGTPPIQIRLPNWTGQMALLDAEPEEQEEDQDES